MNLGSRVATRLGSIFSLLTIIAVVVGVPAALVVFVGWPLPTKVPTMESLSDAFEREGVPLEVIVNGLAIVVWVAWAQLTWALAAETRALAQGRVARHARVWPGAQMMARSLVASAALVVSSLGGVRTVHAAPLAALQEIEVPEEDASLRSAEPGIVVPDAPPAPTAPTAPGEPDVSGLPGVTPTDPAAAATGVTTPPSTPTAPAAPTAPTGPTVSAPTRQETIYEVQRGDTFWGLAEQHLGNGMRWREIRDRNVGRAVAPGRTLGHGEDRLEVGWRIVLPAAGPSLPLSATIDGALPSEPLTAPASVAPPGTELSQLVELEEQLAAEAGVDGVPPEQQLVDIAAATELDAAAAPAGNGNGAGTRDAADRAAEAERRVAAERAAEAARLAEDVTVEQELVAEAPATAEETGTLVTGARTADPAQASAASSAAPPQTPAPPAGVGTLTVQPGDHFWGIAERQLEEAWGRPVTAAEIAPYWRTLIDANRSRIVSGDPDVIFPGQVFSTPATPSSPGAGGSTPAPRPTPPAPEPEPEPEPDDTAEMPEAPADEAAPGDQAPGDRGDEGGAPGQDAGDGRADDDEATAGEGGAPGQDAGEAPAEGEGEAPADEGGRDQADDEGDGGDGEDGEDEEAAGPREGARAAGALPKEAAPEDAGDEQAQGDPSATTEPQATTEPPTTAPATSPPPTEAPVTTAPPPTTAAPQPTSPPATQAPAPDPEPEPTPQPDAEQGAGSGDRAGDGDSDEAAGAPGGATPTTAPAPTVLPGGGTTAPEPADEGGTGSEAPSATFPDDTADDELAQDFTEDDDESGGVPLLAVAGSAALAGLVLMGLARRRRARSRSLRPGGHVEPRLEADILAERDLAVAAGDVLDVVWATSRALGAVLAVKEDLPAVTAVLVGADRKVTVHFAEPFDPAPPFEVGPTSDRWTLYLDDLDEVDLVSGPEPAVAVLDTLTALGRTDNDEWLFVDLESLGALELAGDPVVAAELAQSIVTELTLQPASDNLVDLTVVGVDELAPSVAEQGVANTQLDQDLVRRFEQSADETTSFLDMQGLRSTAAARAKGLARDGLFVTVVAFGGAAPADPVLLERLASAATPGGRGVAVVAVGALGAGATRVIVHSDGRAHIPRLGLTVTAARLERQDLDRISELLAREPDTAPRPPEEPDDVDPGADPLWAVPRSREEEARTEPGPGYDAGAGAPYAPDEELDEAALRREFGPPEVSPDYLEPSWRYCVRIFADHMVETPEGEVISFRYGDNPDVPNKNTHRGPELLSYLALSGRAASATDVRDHLWWDRPVALGTVNKLLYGTRKVLGGADLLSLAQDDPVGRYRLSPEVVTDVELLAHALQHAHSIAQLYPDVAIDVLRNQLARIETVAFRSGHLGQGLAEWAAAYRVVDRVEQPVIDAALLVAKLSTDRGPDGYEEALWAVDQGLFACPVNEALVRAAMEIEARLGSTEAVNARYLTLAARLARDELEPEPETIDLRARLGGGRGRGGGGRNGIR
ncbi:MAG TPA: LysM peptidoglycan-binding domain-containing protein [Acidimicrobiales bacterium]